MRMLDNHVGRGRCHLVCVQARVAREQLLQLGLGGPIGGKDDTNDTTEARYMVGDLLVHVGLDYLQL